MEQTQLPPYQELLRLIGRDLDRWQTRSCRIEEGPIMFVVYVLSAGSQGGVQQIYRLDKEVLPTRMTEAIRRRTYRQPRKRSGTGELPVQA